MKDKKFEAKVQKRAEKAFESKKQWAIAENMPFNAKSEWNDAVKGAKNHFKGLLEKRINTAEKNYNAAYNAYNNSHIKGPDAFHNLNVADERLSKLQNKWHERYGSAKKGKK